MSELHMENFCGLCSEHLSRCKCSERALKEQVVSLCSRVGELEKENAALKKEMRTCPWCEVEHDRTQHDICKKIKNIEHGKLLVENDALAEKLGGSAGDIMKLKDLLSAKSAECEALRGALEKIATWDGCDSLRSWKGDLDIVVEIAKKALSPAKPTMPAPTPVHAGCGGGLVYLRMVCIGPGEVPEWKCSKCSAVFDSSDYEEFQTTPSVGAKAAGSRVPEVPHGGKEDAPGEELIGKAIENALRDYNCQHTEDLANGEGLPLVDMLCPPKSQDISKGQAEMNCLADHIFGYIQDALRSGGKGDGG